MAYSEVSDIESEFKNITFDSNSAIEESEVNLFIAQEDAVIDATISNRYEVPITGSNAIVVMRKISIAYVAYRVAKILNLKKDIPIPKEMISQSINEASTFRVAKKNLEDIQSGKIVLNDAVARSSEQGVKSYNASNSIGPLWERDTKQW